VRSEDSALDRLIERVADGQPIDLPDADAAGLDEAQRRLLQHLRTVASMAEVHADHAAEDSDAAVLRPSTRWTHLALLEKIGQGSTGEVFRALDPHLDREIAVKLLKPWCQAQESDIAQLLAEGRALARVHHPNVVTIYGIDEREGRIGLRMEFIRGRTLEQLLRANGAFGAREAVAIGQELCRALSAVHAAGLVHRDVKCQNVMREDGGRLVLMDFGSGRLRADLAADQPLLAGTPLYLSPEVLRGQVATPQADLYSLGVLLFHLLTNDYPFTGSSVDALRDAQARGRRAALTDLRPDIGAALATVVDRAVAADPHERWSSAGEMHAALAAATDTTNPGTVAMLDGFSHRMVGGVLALAIALLTAGGLAALSAQWRHAGLPGPARIRAVAVPPFESKEGEQSTLALASALAADIASRLQGPDLIVKGRAVPPDSSSNDRAAFGRRVGADATVVGALSVQRDALSLEIDLVRSEPREIVWRRVYRTSTQRAAALPQSVAGDIASAIGVSAQPPRSPEEERVSFEAYGHYARGLQLAEKREPASLLRSAQQFEEAIKLAPEYASAWAGLADVWMALGVPAFGPLRPNEARGRAREAALKALDIDPSRAEAHTSLAFLSFFYDWNWTAADERFQRALSLNPQYAPAHHLYADYLNAMGRFDEATRHINKACELEPLSILFQRDVAWHLFFQQKYEEAITQLRRTLQQDPGYMPARSLLGRALVQAGRFREGVEELQRLDLENPANAAMLAYAYAASGDRGRSDEWLERLKRAADREYVSPYSIALIYTAMGNRPLALANLRRAVDEEDSTVVNMNVDPRFASLRSEPAFEALRQRLAFPPLLERSPHQ
jgi:tetratricopeptide (TPR) repeat protein/TolB-like protein